MTSTKWISQALVAAAVATLAGCGGGGDGGGGPVPGTTYPSSGSYAVDVTAQGSAGTPSSGLSLVHPSATDVEYVIEPPSAGVADLVIVSSGTVNAAQAKVTSIQPYAALYIVGGDVRRLALVADGSAPTAVKAPGTTNACRFALQADDYAAPEKSRYIVATAGADGLCDTADDSQSEVVLAPAGSLTVTALTGSPRLATLRDPSTLAPRGWMTTDAALYYAPTNGTQPLQAPITRVAASTLNSVIGEGGGGLSAIDFFASTILTQTQLDATLTAGSNWQSIGSDPTYVYLYRNSGSTAGTSNWSVLRIDRATHAVTQLATGTGLISSAAMGTGLLYLTELGTASNRVLTVLKTVAGVPQVLSPPATTTVTTVYASANGRHLLSRRPTSGNLGYEVDAIDESGATPPLLSVANGYLLARPEPVAIDFTRSENHSVFVFASPFGATSLNGASLQTYDAAAGTSSVLGTLPGASRYGIDPVFVSVTEAPSSFLGGYSARMVGGNIQASDGVAFSFNTAVPGSLKLATTKR